MFPTPDAIRGPAAHGMPPLPPPPTAQAGVAGQAPHQRPAHLLLPFAVLTPHGDPDSEPNRPHAGAHAGGLTQAVAPSNPCDLTQLPLPTLRRLLARAVRVTHNHPDLHQDPARSLTPPHEWALAAALNLLAPTQHPLPSPAQPPAPPSAKGRSPPRSATATLDLPDGTLPWAAWACPALLATPDTPAAWFTPCHQEVGTGQVTLHPPAHLALSDAHSQALMAALQPFAAEDGISLTWVAADRWLAQGAVFAHLPTASLDRVAGRSIGPWLSTGPAAAGLRRLQSEAQMLFYTHPAHDDRTAQRLAPINAVWISGTGACPAHARHHAPECAVDTTLRTAALRHDTAAWQQAWQALDAQVLPAWLAHAQQGHPVDITLCGERSSVTLHLAPQSLATAMKRKFLSIFRPLRLSNITSSL